MKKKPVIGFRIWSDGFIKEPEWAHNDCATLQERIVGESVGGTVRPTVSTKMKARQQVCRFCRTG